MALTIRAVLVAVLMLVIYEGAYRGISGRYLPRAENVPIANQMSAQALLYGPPVTTVLLGSSLSNRLRSDLLPAGSYKLALGGLSVWDGLAVIEASGRLPETLLVEANVLDRPASADFASAVLAEPLRAIRAELHGLRASARPLTVGLSYVQAIWRRLLPAPGATVDVTVSRAASAHPSEDPRFAQLLDVQSAHYRVPLTPEELAAIAQSLDRLLALSDRGVRVELFELPVHPSLCEEARPRQLRAWLAQRYPKIPYHRVGQCGDVHTTDGVHLDANEAERVTREFTAWRSTTS